MKAAKKKGWKKAAVLGVVPSTETGPLTDAEHRMFWLGRVVAVHKVGPADDPGKYEIFEYLERKHEGCALMRQLANTHWFYVNGVNEAFPSLEMALLAAIAAWHNEGQTQAAVYAAKAIGVGS